MAHGILGAAVAAATGNDPTSGALSGAGSEILGEQLTKWLYPEVKDPADLTPEQKSTISAIVGLGTAGLGAIAGDSPFDVVVDSMIGQNAVENNSLKDVIEWLLSDSVEYHKKRQESIAEYNRELAKYLGLSENDPCVTGSGNSLTCRHLEGAKSEFSGAYQLGKEIMGAGKDTLEFVNPFDIVNLAGGPAIKVTGKVLAKGESIIENGIKYVLQEIKVAGNNVQLLFKSGSDELVYAGSIGSKSLSKITPPSSGHATGNSNAGKTGGGTILLVPGGGLAAHEAAGGHLIARHVGKTEAELLNRVSTGNVKMASSFTDQATAEAVTRKAIYDNQSQIQNYLTSSQKGYLEINYTSSSVIGISVSKGSTSSINVINASIIIARDSSMSTGYRMTYAVKSRCFNLGDFHYAA